MSQIDKFCYLREFMSISEAGGSSSRVPVYGRYRASDEARTARLELRDRLWWMAPKSLAVSAVLVQSVCLSIGRMHPLARLVATAGIGAGIWTRYGYRELEDYLAREMAAAICKSEEALRLQGYLTN